MRTYFLLEAGLYDSPEAWWDISPGWSYSDDGARGVRFLRDSCHATGGHAEGI
jgi:hypothetical protein